MLGNFRNKDTLQIFNETWKVNNIRINNGILRKSRLDSISPSAQAKRVTKQINNYNSIQRNNFMDKFK